MSSLPSELLQWMTVNASLTVLLVLPALPTVWFYFRYRSWPELVLGAVVLGCSSQAVLGLMWSHLVGQHPSWEVLLFFASWILLSIWWIAGSRSRLGKPQPFPSHHTNRLLFAILAAAFVLRSLHPLETAALGQSDAYAHLQFLRSIVLQGKLDNVVYPPGYHWILALPVIVFQIDPYIVARFAGAFFGTVLVLAVYVLLSRLFGNRTALFGSFCAGCFPGMILLMKTGVGAYANQLGLFFVPCLFLYYTYIVNDDPYPRETALFASAVLGIAASVPIMLLHVLMVILVERVTAPALETKAWFRKSLLVALICLSGIAVIFFHIGQAGEGQKRKTASVFLEHSPTVEKNTAKLLDVVDNLSSDEKKVPDDRLKLLLNHPYVRMIIDYFSFKRMGFENFLINLMAATLLCLFLGSLGYGFRIADTGYVMVGLWGVLTCIQAGTGFLQFSAYQREGWSLLIATCAVSGILAGKLFEPVRRFQWAPYLVGILCIGFSAWSFVHPPGHPPAIGNDAEDRIVQTAREIGALYAPFEKPCPADREEALCQIVERLDPHLPLTLVSRHMTGWSGQGEILPNVLPVGSRVKSMTVMGYDETIAIHPNRQYLFLIDRRGKWNRAIAGSAFYMVSPIIAEQTIRKQRTLFGINGKIRKFIRELDKSEWKVYEMRLSDHLEGVLLRPLKKHSSKDHSRNG